MCGPYSTSTTICLPKSNTYSTFRMSLRLQRSRGARSLSEAVYPAARTTIEIFICKSHKIEAREYRRTFTNFGLFLSCKRSGTFILQHSSSTIQEAAETSITKPHLFGYCWKVQLRASSDLSRSRVRHLRSSIPTIHNAPTLHDISFSGYQSLVGGSHWSIYFFGHTSSNAWSKPYETDKRQACAYFSHRHMLSKPYY